MGRILLRGAAILACAVITACASVEDVKPWQKGELARQEMTFDGDRLEKAFSEHIYSSKEGASGGSDVGGGGCGCN